ncbi:MAG: AroM family protein [Candidatus Caldarchaeum sp.]|nr:AroM family protein [Candidatus Caldarchaeum sp.]MDW8435903.1 AroM family protein [Candidatus Caldarchaeum sp.]
MSKTGYVGFVTIGQSPRNDVLDDIGTILPRELKIVQAGALDEFNTAEEVYKNLRPASGETVYVTRMRSGEEVKVSKERLMPYVETKVRQLEEAGVDVVVILCSGEFPEFDVAPVVVYPDKILKGISSSIQYRGPTAVLVPSSDHLQYGYKKWSKYFNEPLVIPISPYTASLQQFAEVGNQLKRNNIQLAVMDCVGYSFQQKTIIREYSPSTKVVSTRGVIGRIVSELF